MGSACQPEGEKGRTAAWLRALGGPQIGLRGGGGEGMGRGGVRLGAGWGFSLSFFSNSFMFSFLNSFFQRSFEAKIIKIKTEHTIKKYLCTSMNANSCF